MPTIRGNKLIANFSNTGRSVSTADLYAIDYGQKLYIRGLNLPAAFEVHFSKDGGQAVRQVGETNDAGVGVVPMIDDQIRTAGEIIGYIYLHTGNSDGETEFKIKTRVVARPNVTPDIPDPTEQSAIEQAIVALNHAVETTTEKAQTATEQAQIATEQANDAQTFAEQAKASQEAASASASKALTSERKAAQSESKAAQSASEAKTSEDNALDAADRAEQAAAVSGYLHFEIHGGHLWMDRTPNVNVNFYQENGHLFVTD